MDGDVLDDESFDGAQLSRLRGDVSSLILDVAKNLIVPSQPSVALIEGADEPVTPVDIEAEERLEHGLRCLLPKAAVVGEERSKGDPLSLAVLEEPGAVWLIDPIDGTGNYAAGFAEFGSMVALVVDGETVGAWIWSRHDDAVFTAMRGEGVQRNGVLLAERLGNTAAMRGQLLDRFMLDETAEKIRCALGEADLASPTLCAAVSYPAILEGRLAFSIYGRVRPWDHAAGVLLIEEAGGRAQCLDGRRYRPARDDAGLMVSGSVAIHDSVGPAVISAP